MKTENERFNKTEAKELKEVLNDIMKAMPKDKMMNFIGEFNDLFLFMDAVLTAAPEKNENGK